MNFRNEIRKSLREQRKAFKKEDAATWLELIETIESIREHLFDPEELLDIIERAQYNNSMNLNWHENEDLRFLSPETVRALRSSQDSLQKIVNVIYSSKKVYDELVKALDKELDDLQRQEGLVSGD